MMYQLNHETTNKGLQVRNVTSAIHWCGPAALGAALNITTEKAHATIRATSLRKFIKGVSNSEMTHALAASKVRHTTEDFPRDADKCPALKGWLETRDAERTYIVGITGHWITIRGNHWVCNMNVFGRLLTDCPYLKAKVRFAICLTES